MQDARGGTDDMASASEMKTESVPGPREWLPVPEAVAYTGLGRRTFYERVVHDPSVPRVRVGIRVLFRRADLDAWLERHLVQGDDPQLVLSHRGRGRRAVSGRQSGQKRAGGGR